MGNVKLEDVLFDPNPLGLAETLREIPPADQPTLAATTGDTLDANAVVYFGLELPSGDVAEAKVQVLSCAPAGKAQDIALRVLAVDANLCGPALQFLKGGSQASSDGPQPLWALGLKQTNGRYATVVNAAAGVLTADQLRGLAELASPVGIVKMTHAQRMVLLTDAEGSAAVEVKLKALGLRKGVLHHGVRNIRACCGALCRWAGGLDALPLSKAIDDALYGRATKFDIKIAVSDCARNCSESYCADIGLVGKNGAYTLVVGGKGSGVPFRALVLKEGVVAKDVVRLILAIIDWYEKNSKEKERFCRTLERIGGEDPSLDESFRKIGEGFTRAGDTVDEGARLKALFARLRGVARLRQDLASQW